MKEAQRLALRRDLAVVTDLKALAFVQQHETRFENEVAFVSPTKHLEEVNATVERYLSGPVKRSADPLPGELASSPVLEAMGGVDDGQTLFLKDLGEGICIYVAYWPWNGNQRFTIKVGVHVIAG